MMETVYEQVEHAIAENLHLGADGDGSRDLDRCLRRNWDYPVGIELGNIIMRDSDCGLAKPTWEITTTEWEKRYEKYGLWKKVGIWDFVPADDPAAGEVRYAHMYPAAAGHEIYRLKQELQKLKKAEKGGDA